MGAFKSIAAAVGIGESPAEKAKKKAKRTAQAASDARGKRQEAAQAASDEGKASAAGKLALIATSSQGVLEPASTGRRKLFGN